MRAGCLPLHTLVSQLPATWIRLSPIPHLWLSASSKMKIGPGPTPRLSLSAFSNIKAGCPSLQIVASKLQSVGFRGSAQNLTITGGLRLAPRSNVSSRQGLLEKQNAGRDGRKISGEWEDSPFWKVRNRISPTEEHHR